MGEIYKYRGIGYVAPAKEGRATSLPRKRVGLGRSGEKDWTSREHPEVAGKEGGVRRLEK